MQSHLHSELKKEFQLERMILFSDAVFAIAITLLVIEIKIPDIHENVTDAALLKELKHLIPKFAGFLISFMLIAMYWTVHHRMFGFVINYTRKLLWLNLFFLLFIVLMPFATGFYGEYAGPELFSKQLKVPMTFYVLNLCAAGLFNYFLWVHISNSKNKLVDPAVDPLTIKMAKTRSIVVPAIFFCMLPVAYFIHVIAAVYIPMFIPVVMKIIERGYKKKMKLAPVSKS
ncbi:MAG TPA: TMEM175 family protein [Chitinophagaceae bacterium]|nr:TMEM175 family protein [Chitinophagaceae bacterium]